MRRYRFVFLLSLFLAHLFAFLHHLLDIIPDLENYAFLFQLLFAFSGPLAYMSYFAALKQTLHAFQLNSHLDLLQQEEKVQEQQARSLESLREQAQNFQSEIFGHLITLREYLKEKDTGQAARKIEQLLDYFEKIRIHPICSDSLLNAILQDRKELADKSHILTSYQIMLPENLELPDSVLCTIFFNLLDNGIESCQKADTEKPFLTLAVQYKAGFLHINMENSKNVNIRFDKKTTKSDPSLHGYGLAIIEELIDKYDGSCEWIDKGDTFQSSLMLCADITNSKDKR